MCGREAVVEVPYAKLRLCKEHFVEWFQRRVLRTAERYELFSPGDKVLVAVSGGKDSVAMLHALSSIADRLGIRVVAGYVDVGVEGYSAASREIVKAVAKLAGVDYVEVRAFDRFGVDTPTATKATRRPACSVCGIIKRAGFEEAAREAGASKIATGHNLDDVLAYAIKGVLIRGEPEVVPVVNEGGDGISARVKPLVELSEAETLIYVNLLELPFTTESCSYIGFASARPLFDVKMPSRGCGCPLARLDRLEAEVKAFLNRLERERPGIKLGMLHALYRRYGWRKPLPRLNRCGLCGRPTEGDICPLCRMRIRAEQLGLAKAGPQRS